LREFNVPFRLGIKECMPRGRTEEALNGAKGIYIEAQEGEVHEKREKTAN
jgi:hypothetical protein